MRVFHGRSYFVHLVRADLVAFGRAILANPDLVERFRENEELDIPDRAMFCSAGEKGYIDHPTLGATGAARS